MSERLRDDPDGLSVLCAAAADWLTDRRGTNVPALVVEKDFWVTELLRACTTPQLFARTGKDNCDLTVRPVLKGGTSLSKAYGIIEQFSEDADVYLDISPADAEDEARNYPVGNSRVDTIMRATATMIGMAIGVEPKPVGIARTGTKRGYAYQYPNAMAATASGFKEGVLLELVRMGTPTPNAPHTIQSLLADYASATGRVPAEDFDELAPFRIDVLCPERTLVDKLSILHGVATEALAGENPRAAGQLAYHSRHYYDVHRLLTNQAVMQSLQAQPGLVAAYAKDAYAESIAARRPATVRPVGGFAVSPAFRNETVLGRARADYEIEMNRLSLGVTPDFDEVITSVATAAPHL